MSVEWLFLIAGAMVGMVFIAAYLSSRQDVIEDEPIEIPADPAPKVVRKPRAIVKKTKVARKLSAKKK